MARSNKPQPRLTCLSTFTGLGGMDLGLEAAGFDHLGCIEWEEVARRSLKANRGDTWPLLEPHDIEAVAAELVPEDLGLAVAELDLLVGAPPCQPYSKAAQWAASGRKGLGDRRGQYLDDFLTLLATFHPKVAVIENVRGFVQGKTSALDHIAACLAALEDESGMRYVVDHRILDAADVGVAQKRSRAIVVISRLPHEFPWPAACDRRVAWDAIGDLPLDDPPVTRGKWAGLLPTIPEGENYLWHTSRGGGEQLFGYRTRYWSFLLKLAKDQPSWTLPAHPGPSTGPFHWDNRPLSIQELLRLQSFPSDWVVEGSTRIDQVRQIGNATPPLLAEAIGRSVIAHLRGAQPDTTPLSLAIDPKRPVPPPAPPAPLPRSFLAQVREHPDHPGHGKGPGALRAAAQPEVVASMDSVERSVQRAT